MWRRNGPKRPRAQPWVPQAAEAPHRRLKPAATTTRSLANRARLVGRVRCLPPLEKPKFREGVCDCSSRGYDGHAHGDEGGAFMARQHGPSAPRGR